MIPNENLALTPPPCSHNLVINTHVHLPTWDRAQHPYSAAPALAAPLTSTHLQTASRGHGWHIVTLLLSFWFLFSVLWAWCFPPKAIWASSLPPFLECLFCLICQRHTSGDQVVLMLWHCWVKPARFCLWGTSCCLNRLHSGVSKESEVSKIYEWCSPTTERHHCGGIDWILRVMEQVDQSKIFTFGIGFWTVLLKLH